MELLPHTFVVSELSFVFCIALRLIQVKGDLSSIFFFLYYLLGLRATLHLVAYGQTETIFTTDKL
jgi:hypothetical protein